MLDIGSNAAQLQIVDVRPGGPPLPAYRVKHPTGLGAQIGHDGTITPKGIERVARATREAVAVAGAHEVGQLFVFASASVRDARNRQEVLDQVESLTRGARRVQVCPWALREGIMLHAITRTT